MKTFLKLILAAAAFAAAGCSGVPPIENMRCEYTHEPQNLDEPLPRFTWIYTDPDFRQASFEIAVATDPKLLKNGTPDVWESGIIDGGRSFAKFAGTPFESGRQYFWRVRAWDAEGRELKSKTASFSMAKMETFEWMARWISDGHDKDYRPSPMLRRAFTVDKPVKRACVYVTGVGFCEFFLNGKKIGDHMLDPAFTKYDTRVLYSTFDVTEMLQKGDNAMAAVLGNSFYNWQPQSTWDYDRAYWRQRPRMICRLEVEYTDGTTEAVVSDGSWKTSTGPYLYNNMFSGDVYDARLEQEGWNDAGFDDSAWTAALEVESPTQILQSQTMPPMRVKQELKAVSMKEFPGNIRVYDFGVNITGFCRMKVRGEAGTKVRLRFGEMLDEAGRVDRRNIDIFFHPEDPDEEFQSDVYYLRGGGTEEYTPSFNYHGFQYVEVESDRPVELTRESLTGLFFYTDVERVGSFSCSNEMFNKIHEATMRAYLGNLHGIPTDCPQREKNGWTADAYLAIDLALLNYDGMTFYEKWLTDIIDSQRPDGSIPGTIPTASWGYTDWIGPVWDAVMFIVPNALYNYYGDTKPVEMMYETCERYLEYLQGREVDGTVTYGLGDWVPWKTHTPTEFTSTCFYYYDNVLMARFAQILGRDGERYAAKAQWLRDYINEHYFDAEKLIYSNGSQNALAVALELGIVPDQYAEQVAAHLAQIIRDNDWFIDSGVMGSRMIPRALTRYGYIDTVWRMMNKDTPPSWGYWIKQGYTTLAEQWTIPENWHEASLNHVFFGDISAWMVNRLAGIRFDEENPGFTRFVIDPVYPEGLDWAKAEYNSVNGLIASSWKRNGGKVTLEVTIPANTTATVVTATENLLGGGKYSFTFAPRTDYK